MPVFETIGINKARYVPAALRSGRVDPVVCPARQTAPASARKHGPGGAILTQAPRLFGCKLTYARIRSCAARGS